MQTLLDHAQSIAKGWLLALLEVTPLSRTDALPVADFAAGAPGLCAAIARALSSDVELARLEPGGDEAPLAISAARLAGAAGPTESLAAVDALRAVLWAALRPELALAGDPELVADVAERLDRVCAVVAAAAVGASAGELPGVETRPAAPRSLEGPEWRRALAEQLDRSAKTGEPVALLLLEIEEADRLAAAGGAGTLANVVRAVRAEVRRPDLIALEDDGRIWIIAPGVARVVAAGVGQRVLTAVGTVEHQQVPLQATLGVVLYPEDARDAEALADAAESEVLTARADNVRMGIPNGGDDPPRPDLRPVS